MRAELIFTLKQFWIAYHEAEIAKHKMKISKAKLKYSKRVEKSTPKNIRIKE